MIFYNTADKRYTELAFTDLATFGAHAFLAAICADVYTNVEIEYEQEIIFNYIFNTLDMVKFDEVLERLEVFKPV